MKVKLYTTPACPFCSMTKDFLNEHNIPFEEIDVCENEKAAKEMVEKSGQMGVPVIAVSGKSKNGKSKEETIVGFDAPKLKKALKIKD